MKSQFQNQTRGCIGDDTMDRLLSQEEIDYLFNEGRGLDFPIKCQTTDCTDASYRDGYCLKCYEQRQEFLRDDEPYKANHYDWRWLYVPYAGAVALIALLWWLWPKLIALRMGDGTP